MPGGQITPTFDMVKPSDHFLCMTKRNVTVISEKTSMSAKLFFLWRREINDIIIEC